MKAVVRCCYLVCKYVIVQKIMNPTHSYERTLECPSAIQMMLFHSATTIWAENFFFLFCLIQKFTFFLPNKLLSLLDNSNKATLHVSRSKITTNCIVDHTTIRHMQSTTIVSSDLPTCFPCLLTFLLFWIGNTSPHFQIDTFLSKSALELDKNWPGVKGQTVGKKSWASIAMKLTNSVWSFLYWPS